MDLRPTLRIDPVIEDWDFDQGPLVLRMTPLRRLKRLALPAMPRLDVAPVVKAFLEHYPAIDTLEMPYFGRFIDGIGSVIKALVELCFLVSDLSFPVACSGEYLMRIIEVIPADCVRGVCCLFFSSLDKERTINALTPHSFALRRVELTQCTHVASTIIEAVPTTCGTLEVFRVTSREDMGGISLSFAQTLEREWACTRIRHLQIDFIITPDGRNPEYIAGPSKETWTADDLCHWDDLGRLYTILDPWYQGNSCMDNPEDIHRMISHCLPRHISLDCWSWKILIREKLDIWQDFRD